ncbi:MAG: sulfurtransferase [Proteobacteria bacterium]|nr:sulfurtransferase [Pseudomonadota bacterium]
MTIVNIAAYRFLPLTDLRARRSLLQSLCKQADLKGTILLSHEGINLFVAGEASGIGQLLAELRRWPGLADLQPKFSENDHQPFRRMLVRLKKEIIAFGVEGIDPARRTSPKLPAQELKKWLDEGRPITLLDTRNDYEVKLGTFRNALTLGLDHFRNFPRAVAQLPPELKKQPIVMFCTGGIRCEKAGPYMEREGFESVYQLDGGILKYFEEVGGEHYRGECFVFDQRVGLDPSLHETGSSQCFNCQSPLSEADQEHPHYVPGESCPYCFRAPAQVRAAALARRNEQIGRLAASLPGSRPYDHLKPVNIPARFDGAPLLEALCGIFPHMPADTWRARFADGAMLNADAKTVTAAQIVRAGERYLHRVPAVIEPDVNMHVEVLHEDEALVVLNKPAPLPMHPGGRFLRNTLQHLLDTVYSPQKPRPSHRLDANTTGVVVVARTRHFAGQIQPQFAEGAVTKVYLVRVSGHPDWDELVCEAPISSDAGKLGSRAVDTASGLPARTDFRVQRRLADGTALLEARPLTGRTNQIRIHLAHLGYPVCGDPAYLAANLLGESQTLDPQDPPLCLHAWCLTFRHPLDRKTVTFTATAPDWAK